MVDFKILKNICLILLFLIIFYFYSIEVYAQAECHTDTYDCISSKNVECGEVYSGEYDGLLNTTERDIKHVWNITTTKKRVNITIDLHNRYFSFDDDDLDLYLEPDEGCGIEDRCRSESIDPLYLSPENVYVFCGSGGKWQAEVYTRKVYNNCVPYTITFDVKESDCCYDSDCDVDETCLDGSCVPSCVDIGKYCTDDSQCCSDICNIDETQGSRCCKELCPEDSFVCSGDTIVYEDYFCDSNGDCNSAQYPNDKSKPDSDGYIRDWLILGMFNDIDCEGCGYEWLIPSDGCDEWFDFASASPIGGEKLPTGHTWFLHHNSDNRIDLDNEIFEPGVDNNQVTAFAFAYVESPDTRTADMSVGNDDSITVWLNGNLVVDQSNDCTPPYPDRWRSGVTLNQGSNRLLIRVGENTGDWAFYARFLNTTTGEPIIDINISLPTSSYDCISFNGWVSYNYTGNEGCGIINRTYYSSYSCSVGSCVQTVSNENEDLVDGRYEGDSCRYDTCDGLTRYYDYRCTAGECTSPIDSCDDGKACSYNSCEGSGTFDSYCYNCTQEGYYNSIGAECFDISCCSGLVETACLGGGTVCCPASDWFNSSWEYYPCFRNRTVEYREYQCPATEGDSCPYVMYDKPGGNIITEPIVETEFINEGLQCGVGDYECLDDCTKGRKLFFCQSGDCVEGTEYASSVGYWKFDEGYGTTATDSSGNDNDGTIYEATWADGKVDSALNFDGINSYVRVESSESLKLRAAYTVEAWIKPELNPNNYWTGIVGKGNWPNRNYNMWLGASNNPDGGFIHHTYTSASCRNYAINTPYASIKWGEWTHVVIVMDSERNFQKTYLNGILINSRVACGAAITNDIHLSIGKNLDGGSGNRFKGIIDEVKIYNYALTDEEILQEYKKGLEGQQFDANSCSPFSCDAQSSWGCSLTCDSTCGAPDCDGLSPYSSCGIDNYCNYECECKVDCDALDPIECLSYTDDCEVCTGDGKCKFKPGGGFSVASGTVGFWHLDEGGGQIIYDSSPYTNNGTLGDGTCAPGIRNCPSWEADPEGYSLKFDGIDDYARIDNIPVSTTPGANNTVSFWMYWTGTNNQMPLGWNTAYDLWLYGNCFGFNTGQGNVLGVSWNGLDNRWVHVVAIFYNGVPSSTTVSLYINGVKQSIYECRGSTTVSRSVTSTVIISGWSTSPTYKFGGMIDEVKIFNRALTPDEILADYNAGRVRPTLQCQPHECLGVSQYCTDFCQWDYCEGTDVSCYCFEGACKSCEEGKWCEDYKCEIKCEEDRCEAHGECFEIGACDDTNLCRSYGWQTLEEHCGDGYCICENPSNCPDDCRSLQYKLWKGWNLISLPYEDIVNITVDTCNSNELPFYYWENNMWKKIIGMRNIKGRYGYWVNPEWYSEIKTSCDINATANVLENISVDDLPTLHKGYSEIGAPLERVAIEDIKGNCNILQGPLYWDAKDKKWIATNIIAPEKGYWIYVADDCSFSSQ